MPEPASDFSPTIRRRRLSEELKQLRAAAGLTLEQAAKKLEWSRENCQHRNREATAPLRHRYRPTSGHLRCHRPTAP
ncbi:helix-turn-helix domain-containing protein [Nocardiopsis sp. LOL_012]|uniref:helix-turn-helix domain-containing protein n=1 Tax=Nocardiopsis sp. LOL_012 TaxID=3345409 RepID=UPI003A85179E